MRVIREGAIFKKGFILFIIFSLVLVWAGPLTEKVYAQEGYTTRPPLNGWRIAGEIAGGVVGGIAGTYLAGGLIVALADCSGEAAFACALLGFLIGYPVGSSCVVYLIGNSRNETGSFLATLAGGIAGGLPAYEAVYWGCQIPYSALLFAPIGATIGFNLTRRYKKVPFKIGDALINFREGQLSLGVPRIYLRPSFADNRNLIQNIDLVKARF